MNEESIKSICLTVLIIAYMGIMLALAKCGAGGG